MSVTSYKFAGTAATIDRDGKTAWSNPNNAKTDNNTRADNLVAKSTYSDWLRLTNYGFTTTDLPTGCTVDGIEVIIDRYAVEILEGDYIVDNALYLRKTSGQVGDNKASASQWPTSEATATYGGSVDTWSASLTSADVRSSDFGIDLSTYANAPIATICQALVDYIKIRIYYTLAVTTSTSSSTSTSTSITTTSTSTSTTLGFDSGFRYYKGSQAYAIKGTSPIRSNNPFRSWDGSKIINLPLVEPDAGDATALRTFVGSDVKAFTLWATTSTSTSTTSSSTSTTTT